MAQVVLPYKHYLCLIIIFICGTLRAMENSLSADLRWAMIDEIAASLGVHANSRRVWRQRHIPYRWRLPILREAEKRSLPLTDTDFDRRYADTVA